MSDIAFFACYMVVLIGGVAPIVVHTPHNVRQIEHVWNWLRASIINPSRTSWSGGYWGSECSVIAAAHLFGECASLLVHPEDHHLPVCPSRSRPQSPPSDENNYSKIMPNGFVSIVVCEEP